MGEMMGNRKLFIRIICIILAVTLAFSLLISILASLVGGASFSEEIDALETELLALTQRQQEMDAKIEELKRQDVSALDMKVVLDEQIILTQREIDNIDKQIAIYEQMVTTWEEKIANLETQAGEQLKNYKLRLRAMEENGTVMYYSVLFGAESAADFVRRFNFMMEIIEYDNNLYDNIMQYQKTIDTAYAELDLIHAEISEKSTQRLILEAQLEVEVEEATAVIARVESNIDMYRDDFEQMREAETSLQESIANMLEALQRQESTIAAVGTGDFIWPCLNNRNVTQLYGMDLNQIYGIFIYHSGIDISAAYGTNVLAADGGTVVTATYSPSYGYYMIINHGTGATTLYAHLSKMEVQAGDSVVQGQVIGKVGATGAAMQSHLHFEVSVASVRVNPLEYFQNYTIVP